jgi:hypothetical protein
MSMFAGHLTVWYSPTEDLMAIYEYTTDAIHPLGETTFGREKIGERTDLQRLLRRNISLIDPDLFVIADEFSEWEDSKRRIDILAIDRNGDLVVIELKRNESGEHMDLQSLRYAAMVSAMTLDQAVEAHKAYRLREGITGDAQAAVLAFLGWESARENEFGVAVRIMLVSADFSKELTTSVLWLNEQGLDVRCFRLKPFKSDSRIFIEAQQVIPLPEAAVYQVQLRRKAEKERAAKAEQNVFRRFWAALLPKARANSDLFSNVNPSGEQWITASVRGHQFNFYSRQHDGQVEVYITSGSKEENRRRFEALLAHKDAIESSFTERTRDTAGVTSQRVYGIDAAGHVDATWTIAPLNEIGLPWASTSSAEMMSSPAQCVLIHAIRGTKSANGLAGLFLSYDNLGPALDCSGTWHSVLLGTLMSRQIRRGKTQGQSGYASPSA